MGTENNVEIHDPQNLRSIALSTILTTLNTAADEIQEIYSPSLNPIVVTHTVKVGEGHEFDDWATYYYWLLSDQFTISRGIHTNKLAHEVKGVFRKPQFDPVLVVDTTPLRVPSVFGRPGGEKQKYPTVTELREIDNHYPNISRITLYNRNAREIIQSAVNNLANDLQLKEPTIEVDDPIASVKLKGR